MWGLAQRLQGRRKEAGGCGEGVGLTLQTCKVWALLCLQVAPASTAPCNLAEQQQNSRHIHESQPATSASTLQVASASTARCSSPTWMTR